MTAKLRSIARFVEVITFECVLDRITVITSVDSLLSHCTEIFIFVRKNRNRWYKIFDHFGRSRSDVSMAGDDSAFFSEHEQRLSMLLDCHCKSAHSTVSETALLDVWQQLASAPTNIRCRFTAAKKTWQLANENA